MAEILVVEDDEAIADLVCLNLNREGYHCSCARDGMEGIRLIGEGTYDLVLLDIMLPGVDGYVLLEEIKPAGTPVIFLTAKGAVEDRIRGLKAGADDYLVKPFQVGELMARVEALLRRTGAKSTVLRFGDVTVCLDSRQVTKGGCPVVLTAKEFDLLELFLTNPGKVFSREKLLNVVWGYEYPGDVRTVDVHVRRLREKIEPNPSEPRYVHTKWGVGYYFQI